MKMDAKQIEEVAVEYIKKRVNLTDFLSSYIPTNDKEPSWDGSIYIYKSNRKANDNLNGRLPVQVKGHYSTDLTESEISFPIEIAHLKNYQSDGGVLFFVVYLHENEDRTDFVYHAYYLELTPVRLMNILAGCTQRQKKVSIHLKTLPTDRDLFSSMALNCLEHCRKQESFSKAELPTVKELSEKGVLEGIQLFVSGFGPQSRAITALVSSDTYLYAKIEGCAVPQPLSGEITNKSVIYTLEREVSVAGTVFYTNYRVEITEELSKIHIGDSFEIVLPNDNTTSKMNFKVSHMLRKLAKDLPFIIAVIENLCLTIGNQTLELNESQLDLSTFNLEKAKEDAETASYLVTMLDKQGCIDDIDLNTLTDTDWQNLERLAIATNEQKAIPNLMPNLHPILRMKIGALQFILLFQCTQENENSYYISNVLDFNQPIYTEKATDDEKLPVPVSVIYKKEDYISVSNIIFDRLLPQFREYEMTSYIYDMANDVMLRMLGAYDEASGKRKELLYDTALAFAEWLEKAPDNVWDRRISILNRLQIIKRKRAFNPEETNALFCITAASSDRMDVMVGAYLLLDQQGQANFYLQKMNKEERDRLLSYPIGHFWKG